MSLEPVAWQEESGRARSRWTQDGRLIGSLRHRVGDQGITATSGALLPQRLSRTVRPDRGPVVVTASTDTVRLDAVLVRPLLSRAGFTGSGAVTLLQSASSEPERARVGPAGSSAEVRVYDARGRLRESRTIRGETSVRLPAYGVALVS